MAWHNHQPHPHLNNHFPICHMPCSTGLGDSAHQWWLSTDTSLATVYGSSNTIMGIEGTILLSCCGLSYADTFPPFWHVLSNGHSKSIKCMSSTPILAKHNVKLPLPIYLLLLLCLQPKISSSPTATLLITWHEASPHLPSSSFQGPYSPNCKIWNKWLPKPTIPASVTCSGKIAAIRKHST